MNDALWWEVGAAGATAHWFGVRGSRYLRAGHYELAAAELAVAVSIEQKDPAFWLHYGTALINLERFDEAVEALERALAADRENKKKVSPAVIEPVLANLGVAHGRLGQLDVGINYLENALTANPASIEAMNNLAVMYRSRGSLLYAIEVLKSSLALKQDSRLVRELAALSRKAGIANQAGGR